MARSGPLLYAGGMLTALAAFVFYVALARISAVVLEPGWEFPAGWTALAGLWAGAVLSGALGVSGQSFFATLAWLAGLSTASALGGLAVMLNHAAAAPSLWLGLACAAPFGLSGAILAAAAAEAGARADRVYLFGLLGAAGGCLLPVPLLAWLGGPNTAIGAAVLFAASAALWFTMAGSLRGRAIAVMAALGLVALVAINSRTGSIDVRYARGEALRGEKFVKWNSYSRVAVDGVEPGRLALRLDGGHAGYLAAGDPERLSAAEKSALTRRSPGIAYELRPHAKTLIVNALGGEEVLRALAAGSRDVTGVEVNPIIACTLMRGKFSSAAPALSLPPEVRLVVQDARSFVRQSRDFYQVLQVTATAAGEPAEGYLLTVEAIYSFLERLTEDGLLAVTLPSRDSLSHSLVVAAASRALERLGARDPGAHLIVIRDRGEDAEAVADTVVVARRPLSPVDLERSRRFVAVDSLVALYVPGVSSPLAAALNGSLRNIAPPTDNRPRFPGGAVGTAGFVVLAVLSAAAVTATLGLASIKVGARPRAGASLSFFVFTAAGFLSIVMALSGQLSLFVGHPSSKLAVTAPVMLASAGLGVFVGRRRGSSPGGLVAAPAAVALLATALAVLIAPLVSFGAGWPLWLKAGLAVLIAAPTGFLMGMAAAAGFAFLEGQACEAVRWAWTLHASGAALGAATAAVVSLHLGLRETLLLGGLIYLGALLAARQRTGRIVWRREPTR